MATSFKANLLHGMLSGAVAHGLRLTLNLALIPLLIRYLGAADYGFYLVLLNFCELMLALDAGMMTGLIHRLSHAIAQTDVQAMREQLRLGQWLYLGLAVTLALVGWAATPWLLGAFHLSGPLQAVGATCLAITIADGALNLFGCYFCAILKAHCLHRWTNLADGLHGVAANLLSLALLLMGFGLVEILASRLLVSVVKNACLAARALRAEPHAIQLRGALSGKAFRDLFSISAAALIQRLSAFLAHRTAGFVIGAFLSLASVALFGVVERIFSQITQLCLMLSDGLFPAFARMASANEADKSRFFFSRVSVLLHFTASLPTLGVAAFYPQIFHFLSGGTLPVAPTIALACLLGLVSWSIVMQLPASNYLFASGMHRFQTVSSLTTALLNATTCLLLVKPLGLLGVALGIAVPHVLQHQLVTIPMARRRLGVSALAYARQTYGSNLTPLLGAGLIFLLGRLAVERAWMPPFWGMATFGLAGAMLGVALWLTWSASAQERELLKTCALDPLLRRLGAYRASNAEGVGAAGEGVIANASR